MRTSRPRCSARLEPTSNERSSTIIAIVAAIPEPLNGGCPSGPGSSSTTTPTATTSPAQGSSPSGDGGSVVLMKIDGHYDHDADIAWLRFEDYDPNTVVAEEIEA